MTTQHDSTESDASQQEQLIRSLYSSVATGGIWGYWLMPDRVVTWSFDAGVPDPTTYPVDDLIRLSEDVLRTDAVGALAYGTAHRGSITYGYPPLRELLAERAQRDGGPPVGVDGVMLTSGSVHAITIALQAFLDKGDVIALEAPTWNAVLLRARQMGVDMVPVPLDHEGMDVDVLEDHLERLHTEGRRLKLLYTISTFNTPTGLSLSEPRRRRLIELARRWQFLILEDTVYADLRYSGQPLTSIFSLDDTGLVLKIDSFSKTVAPGLRLGWVTGHPAVVGALASVRGDLGVSQWTARVMDRYLRENLLDPHIAQVNEVYRLKRDVAAAALKQHCGDSVRFDVPDGGFYLWTQLSENVDGSAVAARALEDGVACRPGERFFGDAESGAQYLRVAFSPVPPEELERGIAVLAKAIAASQR